MKLLKRKRIRIILGILIIILLILLPNSIVKKSGKNRVFDSTQEMPYNKVGLLLGTTKYLQSGSINPYYKYRIDAAVSLYKSGKISFVLVSGDNGRVSYDEPTTIKNDLIAAGIPEEKIYLDYAGFRTLDSVVRSKEIFGQSSITIISQKFHNERAVYISKHKGISAVGFNARDTSLRFGFKTRMRELLARDKMMLDLIFHKKPKFQGDQIEIK
jgi:SanA protein